MTRSYTVEFYNGVTRQIVTTRVMAESDQDAEREARERTWLLPVVYPLHRITSEPL